LRKLVKKIFRTFDALIFVSAVGIAVRAVAPHLKDKREGISVIVLDELGKFSISLVGGHRGANKLAREIAEKTGAVPVITTSTDVQGLTCAEEIAERLNLEIDNHEMLKKVNSAIASRKKVLIYSDIKFDFTFIRGAKPKFGSVKNLNKIKNFDAVIAITNKIMNSKKILLLRPKNIVIGIGSKKNIEKEKVLLGIKLAMRKAKLAEKSIKAIAIPEFRKNEKGIIEAASELGAGIAVVPESRIKEKEHLFASSSFVKSKVGIGSVSEPCAVLAYKNSKLIRKKVKYKGVTVAIGEVKNHKVV